MSEESDRTSHRGEHGRLDLDTLQVSIRALRLSMVNITAQTKEDTGHCLERLPGVMRGVPGDKVTLTL